MIDPGHMIIHCPSGHQLQAARTDLDKPLACPICGVTFTPSTVSPIGVIPGAEPLRLGYSATPPSAPVDFPGYTTWMLLCWATCFALSIVYGQFGPRYATPPAPGEPLPAGAIGTCLMSCMLVLAAPTAIVLQLMWIFRIHNDARRVRGYDGVSPGLALGLSFIPLFNYPWTAWTMRKLAAFAASGEGESRILGNRAFKASTTCLWLTAAFLALTCTNLSLGLHGVYQVTQELSASGTQVDPVEFQRRVEAYLPAALQYAGTALLVLSFVVYVWAVRKVEAALYFCLGVIPR